MQDFFFGCYETYYPPSSFFQYIHTCTQPHIHTLHAHNTHIHTLHAYNAHIHTHIHTHTHTPLHARTYIYAHMHIHVYTYTHTVTMTCHCNAIFCAVPNITCQSIADGQFPSLGCLFIRDYSGGEVRTYQKCVQSRVQYFVSCSRSDRSPKVMVSWTAASTFNSACSHTLFYCTAA